MKSARGYVQRDRGNFMTVDCKWNRVAIISPLETKRFAEYSTLLTPFDERRE